jgi:hypothetical protein
MSSNEKTYWIKIPLACFPKKIQQALLACLKRTVTLYRKGKQTLDICNYGMWSHPLKSLEYWLNISKSWNYIHQRFPKCSYCSQHDNSIIWLLSNVHQFIKYSNGFDQRVARQQLCKHGPTRNNRWGCNFYVVRAKPSAGNGPMN